MKKIFLSIMLLISVTAFSQIDSTKLKTSVSLQVRDWLFLNSFLKFNPEFDNVYDSMKVKLRVAVSPTFTTVIKVDSVKNSQVIKLATIIRDQNYGIIIFGYSRINTALRSTAYLIGKIDALDAVYTTLYNQKVQGELDDLRSVLQ